MKKEPLITESKRPHVRKLLHKLVEKQDTPVRSKRRWRAATKFTLFLVAVQTIEAPFSRSLWCRMRPRASSIPAPMSTPAPAGAKCAWLRCGVGCLCAGRFLRWTQVHVSWGNRMGEGQQNRRHNNSISSRFCARTSCRSPTVPSTSLATASSRAVTTAPARCVAMDLGPGS